jgi:hypothetical protein
LGVLSLVDGAEHYRLERKVEENPTSALWVRWSGREHSLQQGIAGLWMMKKERIRQFQNKRLRGTPCRAGSKQRGPCRRGYGVPFGFPTSAPTSALWVRWSGREHPFQRGIAGLWTMKKKEKIRQIGKFAGFLRLKKH